MPNLESRLPEFLDEIREAARLAARCSFLEDDLRRERQRRAEAEAERDDYRRRLFLAEAERDLIEGLSESGRTTWRGMDRRATASTGGSWHREVGR